MVISDGAFTGAEEFAKNAPHYRFVSVGGGKDTSVEDRISAYTRKGARKLAASRAAQAEPQTEGMTGQAVGNGEVDRSVQIVAAAATSPITTCCVSV